GQLHRQLRRRERLLADHRQDRVLVGERHLLGRLLGRRHDAGAGGQRGEALGMMFGLASRLRAAARSTSGAAAVEFAIILPVLAAFVIGIIQYGGMIIAYDQMHDAVSSGAVYVMRGGSTSATIKSVATNAWANPPGDANVNVSQACLCAGLTSSCSSLC